MTSFNSKTTISRALWLTCIASTLALAACGGRRDKSTEEYIEGAPFRVESFSAKDVQISKVDTLGLPAAKTYTFIACVQDSVMRAPIIYTFFDINDGESSKTVRTDNNGCLLWDEMHPVDSLQNESLLKITRTIIGKDAVQGSVKMDLAFNPLANDPSAIQDLRKFTPVYKMAEAKSFTFNTESNSIFASDASKKAIVNLGGLSLEQGESNFAQYRVNKLLTLQWARDYQISLTPTMIRKKLDSSDETVPLAKGKYRVQFFIVREDAKSPYKPTDIITGFDQVVEVSPYPISQLVTIPVQDPSLISSRTKALIKVSVVGESENKVRSAFYVAKVAPIRGGDTAVKFLTTKEDVGSLFEQQNSGSALPSMDVNETGLSVFAKRSGFKPADMSAIAMDAIDDNQSLFFPSNDKTPYNFEQAVAKYISGQPMSPNEKALFISAMKFKTYQYCNENLRSKSFFNPCGGSVELTVRDFVVDVTNVIPKQIGFSQDYNLAVNTTFSYGESTHSSTSWDLSGKFDMHAGISTPGLDPIGADKTHKGIPVDLGAGLSGGFSWGGDIGKSKDKSKSTSGSVSTGQSLVATAETYEIGVETKKCLLFAATAKYKSQMSKDGKTEGFIVCAKGTEKKNIRETYYIVDQPISSTFTRDGDAAGASHWRTRIRGVSNFNIFNKVISNPNIVMNFQKFSEDPKLDQLTTSFKIYQDYPGVVSADENQKTFWWEQYL